ncbi:bifunctional 2-polyprenyl-6-hydroxyphenol methylase/3-demethylubiquinol 3-O-methyltransferase UbiG [Porphyrobacter algicida]|uniref:Ubiquinone biosynthesis O-methyltransferase n=1 Tax=Qipengyuania algicida TaxID=1836209 RepID=A0A845AM95_9SPHN|nr:bifunctional 2-polyprenyl-6-hydroxyphenol methylase/3-demethylubiquinol 3-O-methyltransferase UbiG [Qipengyuania algicida]MXP28128.1 bifunctional 2-polyprenyl-6-hydroxyphenol methylase/3-demethylubiquinol 3-O-methyltransferase UbiG [Qipengyuania algicida]
MGDATVSKATIRAEEAEHFGRLASEWWNPKGSSAMLHRMNPVRLGYIRTAIDTHFQTDSTDLKPLAAKTALDVGCGAGLLCEPLARLGAQVTGVDAAPENIAAAQAHALGSGLAIDYRSGDLAALDLGQFDLVTAMEVLEHVADKPAFLAALAASLKPGGLLVLSTPNRTPKSRLLLVGAAEAVGAIPRGTHDWDDFVTLDELDKLFGEAGLKRDETRGICFSPLKGFHLTDDLSLDIICAARHG